MRAEDWPNGTVGSGCGCARCRGDRRIDRLAKASLSAALASAQNRAESEGFEAATPAGILTLPGRFEGWRGAVQSRYVAENIDGARCVVLGGDDYWWFLGDSAPLLDVIEEFVTGGNAAPAADRVLATVMFSDMVRSTEQTARMGDRRWRELLAAHDGIVQSEVDRFRGRAIKSMGDGFLATFDGPGRALRCASAVRDAVRSLQIDLRVGVHTGEIELRGDDIAGLAVVIAQRVQAAAEPGENPRVAHGRRPRRRIRYRVHRPRRTKPQRHTGRLAAVRTRGVAPT